MLAGAALWMTATADPPAWLAPIGLAAASIGFIAVLTVGSGGGRWRPLLAGAFGLIAAFSLGAAAAQIRTALVDAPRIDRPTGAVRLTGWVMEIEPGASRDRMRVLVDRIEGDAPQLRYVRASVKGDGAFPPGRAIDCLVPLRPPEGPMAPLAYDSARRAYFQRVGATAIVLGRCRPTNAPPPPAWTDRVALYLAAVRRDASEAIVTALPGEGGALTAAMVTGDRSLISDTTNVVFRDSGLGHMLSVSGLHMALVAGGLYTALYFGLALIPPLALRYPIRKWAASAALIAAAVYLVVSGVSVPAQRAFVMTAVAFGAVLLDRPVFTVRALAVAVVLIILLAPESVVDPGFQMSFAATAALVAAFENRRTDALIGANPGALLSGLAATWRSLSDMLLASLVAGLATDPFAIFHFQRFSVYGLAANLISTPIISFMVAPAALAAIALAPFGLANAPLSVVAAGLDMVRAVGAVFAARPEAVLFVPAADAGVFALVIAGMTLVLFLRGGVRWAGILPIATGVALYAIAPRPVLWADGDLRAVVARTEARWVAVGDERRMAFARDRLAALAGLSPQRAAALSPPDGCPKTHCAWTTPMRRPVVRVYEAPGLTAACVRGAIVLSDVALPAEYRTRCGVALAFGPAELASRGGLSVTETGKGLLVRRAGAFHARPRSGALRRSDG